MGRSPGTAPMWQLAKIIYFVKCSLRLQENFPDTQGTGNAICKVTVMQCYNLLKKIWKPEWYDFQNDLTPIPPSTYKYSRNTEKTSCISTAEHLTRIPLRPASERSRLSPSTLHWPACFCPCWLPSRIPPLPTGCSPSHSLQDPYDGLQNPTYVIYELAPCQQRPHLPTSLSLFILPRHTILHEIPGTHHTHYCLGAFVLVLTTWNVLPSDIHTSITFLFFRCLV